MEEVQVVQVMEAEMVIEMVVEMVQVVLLARVCRFAIGTFASTGKWQNSRAVWQNMAS